MKPRTFIGSAGESLEITHAIHEKLQRVSECTPWDAGVFQALSRPLTDLLRELDQSDFAVFVFAPNDVAIIRQSQGTVVRDNVLFELGLFIGKLGPDRCFFLIPSQETGLRLPTDLVGVAPLKYESDRTDQRWSAVVSVACAQISRHIQNLGFFRKRLRAELNELATQHECCDWIKDENDRVYKKNLYFNLMRGELKREELGSSPVNKPAILISTVSVIMSLWPLLFF